MVSAATDALTLPRARAERPLYMAAALVAALVVLGGFAPTYYLNSFFGAADLTTLKHVHGVVMTSWFLLFIVQARRAAAGISPLVFLVLPLGELVAFVGLFSASIALRRRGDYHKRLMLLASISMLAPAFARFPTDALGLSGPPVFFALTDLVILACIGYDTVKNRRLHPAFASGLAYVVVVQIGRLVLSQTAAWTRFAMWLTG